MPRHSVSPHLSTRAAGQTSWVRLFTWFAVSALLTWVPATAIVVVENKKPAWEQSRGLLGLGYCLFTVGMLIVAGLSYAVLFGSVSAAR
jgi:hypothetical protein